MYIYAELDENGIVFSISQLHSQEPSENMILLETSDDSLLGKKYVNGEFIEV